MIYTIKVNKMSAEKENLKALVTMNIGGCLKVTGIALYKNKGNGNLFVSMPKYKTKEINENGNPIYKEVCNPINAELRKDINERIIRAYNNPEENEPELTEVKKPKVSVKVVPYSKEGSNIKGYAKIYIDDSFVINNVSIYQRNNGLSVSMPSYKTKQVGDDGKPIYQEYCYPVTKEFREYLHGMILENLEAARNQADISFEENCNRISEKDDMPELVLDEENLPSFLK